MDLLIHVSPDIGAYIVKKKKDRKESLEQLSFLVLHWWQEKMLPSWNADKALQGPRSTDDRQAIFQFPPSQSSLLFLLQRMFYFLWIYRRLPLTVITFLTRRDCGLTSSQFSAQHYRMTGLFHFPFL